MKRILAVDFGMRRIGLAVSDPLQIIATPLETLTIKTLDDGIGQIRDRCNDYDLEAVVMGYPLGISGNKTEQTKIVEKVIDTLKTCLDIPIIPWDERYTSVQAKDMMIRQGRQVRNNKGIVDQMAARIMLQEYLDSKIK